MILWVLKPFFNTFKDSGVLLTHVFFLEENPDCILSFPLHAVEGTAV